MERTGVVAQHVNNGGLDTANLFPSVGRVGQDGFSPGASGVLVSPLVVVSTRHAFEASGEEGDVNWSDDAHLYFTTRWDTQGQRFKHTLHATGHVMIRSDPDDEDRYATDLVLFELDEPVPYSVVRPARLPGARFACGASFAGTLVGFGQGLTEPVECDAPNAGLRQFSAPTLWSRGSLEDGSAYYGAEWGPMLDPCEEYMGSGKGDSGGALFHGDALTAMQSAPQPLCGVIAWKQWFTSVVLPSGLVVQDREAATDSVLVWPWLMERALDPDGNMLGECPALLNACLPGHEGSAQCAAASVDADRDRVFSACDSCPSMYNPEQLTEHDDEDGDGVGRACDLCPDQALYSTAPSYLGNCNYETELVRAYPPGVVAPPPSLFAPDDYSGDAVASVLAEESYYRGAFTPDGCDPNPCPRQDLLAEGALPGFGDVVCCDLGAATIPSDCHCSELDLALGKSNPRWSFDNTLTLSPVAPMGAAAPDPSYRPGAAVTVGSRWCPCDENTSSLEGRLLCYRYTECKVRWQAYTEAQPLDGWQPLTTSEDDWATSQTGKEHAMALLSPTSTEARRVLWNFLTVGFVEESHLELASGAQGPLVSAGVNGILWAAVVSHQVTGTKEFAHTYQGGNAEVHVEMDRPEWLGLDATDEWWLESLCPGCPEGLSRLRARPDDPYLYTARPDGMVVERSVHASVRELLHREAQGELRVVPASEPLARILRSDSTPVLRAVGLDVATASVSRLVTQAGLDGILLSSGRTPRAGSPTIDGDEALVLSSTLGQVIVLGGNVPGAAGTGAEPSAWMLDVATNEWSELPLEPEDRAGPVVAATYRMEDFFVYVVDRRDDSLLLERWLPGSGLERVATLPADWLEAERHWLVAGADGSLLYAASMPASLGGASTLARFVLDSSGRARLAGVAHIPEPLLAAPSVSGRAVTVVLPHCSGGRLAVVPFEQFGPAASWEIPQFYGWPVETVVALESAAMSSQSEIDGSVAVLHGGVGPALVGQLELSLGPRATVRGSVRADSVALGSKAVIAGTLGYNDLDLHPQATVVGPATSPLALPLAVPTPAPPGWSAGGPAVQVVAGTSQQLEPGSYDALVVESGGPGAPAKVLLAPGRYGFTSIALGERARLECQGACELVVAGRLAMGAKSFFGVAVETIGSRGLTVTVLGSNGGPGCPRCQPAAVDIEPHSELRASLFAPHGTVSLGTRSAAAGHLVGQHVLLQPDAVVSSGAH